MSHVEWVVPGLWARGDGRATRAGRRREATQRKRVKYQELLLRIVYPFK